ncbi:TetR family transcriptional regulator [Streptomyces sp. ME01-24h]|nr:TetR family transcriptional regulator [Streptomyces sp. ME19-03-3]MDX3352907.1 TetR family transcriptional regulator [Streptomyces sp. ME01-24h]
MAAEAGGTGRRGRGRPAGSRSGTLETRDRILAAARQEFSARGYDKTSIRSIATSAGVDPALVHHYFGAKEQVFAAAIEVSFEPAFGVPDVLAAGPEGVGERLARFFVTVWENPVSRAPMLAIVRSAVTNDTAAGVLRGIVLRRLLERVASELEVPDPRLRAELAGAQMFGIAMMRYVIRLEPLASADIEEVIALVAPTLQRYLTDPGPVGG